MDITIDLKNYTEKLPVFKRMAARAVIREGDKYLLIYSKYGDYKFPGGGAEEGETLEETLIREVQEETGYYVGRDSIKQYGKVFERRKGEHGNIMEMDSWYFLCERETEAGSRNLDEYEKEYDYRIAWMTLQEAIEKNRQVKNLAACPWVVRDTKVMERLVQEEYFFHRVFPFVPEDMNFLIQGHSFETDSIGCSGAHIFMFDNNLVLKVEPIREDENSEYRMLEWLQGRLPVPEIVKFHSDGISNYLLMTRLPGKMACDPESIADGEKMVRLLAKGLKKIWMVDTEGCPRTVGLDNKLEEALERVRNNQVDLDDAEPETFGPDGFENPLALYEYLRNNRPKEEPVLVHGDYCLPNIFFAKDEISGYLDLGNCGIGDKWKDIALAVRSIRHNLEEAGKKEEYPSLYRSFFEELGLEPDEEKIRYYILLDELF